MDVCWTAQNQQTFPDSNQYSGWTHRNFFSDMWTRTFPLRLTVTEWEKNRTEQEPHLSSSASSNCPGTHVTSSMPTQSNPAEDAWWEKPTFTVPPGSGAVEVNSVLLCPFPGLITWLRRTGGPIPLRLRSADQTSNMCLVSSGRLSHCKL